MNELWLYSYHITACDEMDYQTKEFHGILIAATWTDVMAQLSKYYGDRNIESVLSIKALCEADNHVVEYDEEIVKTIENYPYHNY